MSADMMPRVVFVALLDDQAHLDVLKMPLAPPFELAPAHGTNLGSPPISPLLFLQGCLVILDEVWARNFDTG